MSEIVGESRVEGAEETVEAVIRAEGLSFSYEGVVGVRAAKTPKLILSGVSFVVRAGDFVGILGPNGGGKTTLVRILLGLEELKKSDGGEVRIFGQAPKLGQYGQVVAYIPQRAAQLELSLPMTVGEVVELGLVGRRTWGWRRSREDEKRIWAALQKVQLEMEITRQFSELSGGQRQRVLIARALVAQPRLLVLDEPTVGIDQEAQAEFYQILQELRRREGLTVVMVSHDVDQVAAQVNVVLFLNQKMIYRGDPGQMCATADSAAVADFHCHYLSRALGGGEGGVGAAEVEGAGGGRVGRGGGRDGERQLDPRGGRVGGDDQARRDETC